jgi:hypothetical protein
VRPRNQSYVRSAPSIVLTARFFKRIGRKGAQARIDNSTKEQRREWEKKAAAARWKKDASERRDSRTTIEALIAIPAPIERPVIIL